MPNLTKDIIQEFDSISKKNVEQFFNDVVIFFATYYNQLVDYYSGNSTSISKQAFTQLDTINNQCQDLMSYFNTNATRFKNLKWWLLLEQLEIIDSRLQTAYNINRWSKSSIHKFGYSPYTQLNYITKPNQSLERVAQDIVQTTNPSDDWADIAIQNQLREDDYSIKGGADLQLYFPQLNRNVNVTSVVDVMDGKSIYGKDINALFQFNQDEEDVDVLSPDDTVYQAVDILVNLHQNDNPDYPSSGLQPDIVAGANRASLNFPVINRQMSAAFATDDSLKNFTITNIQVQGVGLSIEFAVNTRLNESISNKVLV